MIRLRVNGREREFRGDPAMPLLWYLRDELGLTGTKFGCGEALCGACTVHQDGRAVRACVTSMARAAGAKIVTIEGLAGDAAGESPAGAGESSAGAGEAPAGAAAARAVGLAGLHPVQRAWIEHNVPQCGYCQAGQIMTAAALLASEPQASDERIEAAMGGNICRCGAYQRILAAVRAAAGRPSAAGETTGRDVAGEPAAGQLSIAAANERGGEAAASAAGGAR